MERSRAEILHMVTSTNHHSYFSADGGVSGMATDPGHEIVDEEFGDSMHNTVVLCSADDAYTLNQVRL